MLVRIHNKTSIYVVVFQPDVMFKPWLKAFLQVFKNVL